MQLPTLLTKAHGEARGERENQDSMEKERPSHPDSSWPSLPDAPASQDSGASLQLCLRPVPSHSLVLRSRAPSTFSIPGHSPRGSSASTSPARGSCRRWVSHLGCPSPVEGREECSPRQDHIQPKNHPADPQSTHRTTSRRGPDQREKDVLTDIGTGGKTKQR